MRIKARYIKTLEKINSKKKNIRCIDMYVAGFKPIVLKDRKAVKKYMRENNIFMMMTGAGMFVNPVASKQ